MKRVPFPIIKSAKGNDLEAVNFILQHFEGYIARRCLNTYADQYGNRKFFVDEDLRYHAESALLSAIFTFRFQDPPEDFIG